MILEELYRDNSHTSKLSIGLSDLLKQTRRKVFISYYHYDDQAYKNEFERLFGHLFINKSVRDGDIDSDNSAEYIKRLIQSSDYLADASVSIVLCGPNTWKRKHVDWEIYGTLDKKLNGYSGLIGILLPNFPLNWTTTPSTYNPTDLPARLNDNVVSKFADLYRWDTVCSSEQNIKNAVETAFNKRTKAELIRNARTQMQRNLS
jgi:hypothetical protein